MKSLFHLLHIAGVIVWIGGMFFAHVCLRPVAAEQLQPPQRLPLLAAVLGRFFAAVAISIVAILASGLAIMLPLGMGNAPIHWHIMLTSGLVMTGIFAYIALVFHPRLKRGVAAQDWPAAGAAMNRIRGLVLTNLILGATTVALAILGTYA
jgi:uncharacterized membrane protein